MTHAGMLRRYHAENVLVSAALAVGLAVPTAKQGVVEAVARVGPLGRQPAQHLQPLNPKGRRCFYLQDNAVLTKSGVRYQMPLEITQIAMGVTFLAIWAFAGNILVGRRK